MAEQIISPQVSLLKSLPPFRTIATGAVLIFLIWAFFSKQTMRFYASFVFLFYSMTHSMWISVVMLGIFQTLILIPFRIINLAKSKHLKDFESKINELEHSGEQSFLIKKSTKTGNRIMLYYLIDFMVSLTSYVTIGRLFLTDFYNVKLDPWLLYPFVKYPEYPIQDVWFKIPYPIITQTTDAGAHLFWLVCLAIIIVSLLVSWGVRTYQKPAADGQSKKAAGFVTWFLSSSILFMIIAYFLLRHWPTAMQIAIFTGDVGKPNPQFNSITAIATFATIFLLDIKPILKKGDLAREAGISDEIIRRTQTQLFGETLRSAIIVGLGAYYITNQIPCAFELSIFTLEIISWLSPWTLDKVILQTKPKEIPQEGTPESPVESPNQEKPDVAPEPNPAS